MGGIDIWSPKVHRHAGATEPGHHRNAAAVAIPADISTWGSPGSQGLRQGPCPRRAGGIASRRPDRRRTWSLRTASPSSREPPRSESAQPGSQLLKGPVEAAAKGRRLPPAAAGSRRACPGWDVGRWGATAAVLRDPSTRLKNPSHRRTEVSNAAKKPLCDWGELASTPLSWIAAEVVPQAPASSLEHRVAACPSRPAARRRRCLPPTARRRGRRGPAGQAPPPPAAGYGPG
jgi:hypothetical protein